MLFLRSGNSYIPKEEMIKLESPNTELLEHFEHFVFFQSISVSLRLKKVS